MPAVSKSQQRLMGMVHAYNKGELGDVSPDLKKKIKQIAKSMKKKDAKEFAQTSHEDLPKKVKNRARNSNFMSKLEQRWNQRRDGDI